MSRTVLAIDKDEVIFPFLPHINDFFNARFGTQFSPKDYLTYELEQVWGIDQSEAVGLVHEFLRLDHLSVHPIEGALEVLARLREHFRLVVVTARDGEFEAVTREWLQHRFTGYFDDVVLAGNHYTGRGYRTKVEICQELGAVCLIDDSMRHLTQCAEQGIAGLLFGDYPWNAGVKLPLGVEPARDWYAVERILARRFQMA